MRGTYALLALSLALPSSIACAQTPGATPVPARQLDGVTAAEASALIGKLEAAQARLRASEFQPFELLAGSIASYEMTKVSARDAFMRAEFAKTWSVTRIPTDNRLWQPYKLAYAPDGLGKLYWEIEVVLGSSGNIERVTMLYKPPAPF